MQQKLLAAQLVHGRPEIAADIARCFFEHFAIRYEERSGREFIVHQDRIDGEIEAEEWFALVAYPNGTVAADDLNSEIPSVTTEVGRWSYGDCVSWNQNYVDWVNGKVR